MLINSQLKKFIEDFNVIAKPRRSIFFWRESKGATGWVETPKQHVHVNRTGDYYTLSWGNSGEAISYEANFNLSGDNIHILRVISYRQDSGSKKINIDELSETSDSQEAMQSKLIKLLGL